MIAPACRDSMVRFIESMTVVSVDEDTIKEIDIPSVGAPEEASLTLRVIADDAPASKLTAVDDNTNSNHCAAPLSSKVICSVSEVVPRFVTSNVISEPESGPATNLPVVAEINTSTFCEICKSMDRLADAPFPP